MHLASQLRSLALEVSDVELKLQGRTLVLDAMMDLHNDLNTWAVNTEHEAASIEVMAILDRYLEAVSQAGMPTSTQRK